MCSSAQKSNTSSSKASVAERQATKESRRKEKEDRQVQLLAQKEARATKRLEREKVDVER